MLTRWNRLGFGYPGAKASDCRWRALRGVRLTVRCASPVRPTECNPARDVAPSGHIDRGVETRGRGRQPLDVSSWGRQHLQAARPPPMGGHLGAGRPAERRSTKTRSSGGRRRPAFALPPGASAAGAPALWPSPGRGAAPGGRRRAGSPSPADPATARPAYWPRPSRPSAAGALAPPTAGVSARGVSSYCWPCRASISAACRGSLPAWMARRASGSRVGPSLRVLWPPDSAWGTPAAVCGPAARQPLSRRAARGRRPSPPARTTATAGTRCPGSSARPRPSPRAPPRGRPARTPTAAGGLLLRGLRQPLQRPPG
jgi:hypothetical protein